VIERKLAVPKPRIRKIEQNPAISIQSFLMEEEKSIPGDGGKATYPTRQMSPNGRDK
jgi:hypothetical protein